MSETAGSCGIESQCIVAREFMPFKNNTRRMIQQELRKNELAQKNRECGLSNSEKAELMAYKAGEVLDWFRNAGNGSICYSA